MLHTLINYFLAIKTFKPKAFFFENVHGFVFKPHKAAMEYFEKESKKLGYNISYKVINCADFGVPQIRQRFICVGFRKDLGKFIFPNPTHSNQDKDDNLFFLPWVTCKDAICDFDYPLKEDKDKKEEALKGLKEQLANENATSEEINLKVEPLNTAAMKLGEMMYKESQEQATADGANGDNKNNSEEADVVDADFEEVKPNENDEKTADK